ncbi:MAG: urease accessory protein UreD [Steroidobacteraceae bacterium]
MNATAASSLRAGWRGELSLEFGKVAQRTVLRSRQHTGPLLVQRPFYPEGHPDNDPCHLYLIHPPGGVVGGDELQINVRVDRGAHALLTTPAAGKFYRSLGAEARFTQDFAVCDADLEWLPQENIYYSGTAARVSTRLQLHGQSRALCWEIGCLGLPASNAAFAAGAVRQSLELWQDGQPLLIDQLVLRPEALPARWGLAGQVALGTLLCFPADAEQLQKVRALLAEHPYAGVTLVERMLICRVLAPRADQLRELFVRLWSVLRPGLFNRAAVAPRIWAT